MAMSPSMRGASSGPLLPVGCRAGNDSTLVGLSMPRQLLLRVRIPASSVSMTASSASPAALFGPALTISAAVAMARWMTASASGSVCQQSATTRTSAMGRADSAIGPESLLRGELAPARSQRQVCASRLDGCRPLRQSFIGGNDTRHQFVADHVFGRELHLGDALDAIEQLCGFGETRSLAVRQVDLGRIAGDDHAAVLAKPRQKHLHL